jgi:hypothetical protein
MALTTPATIVDSPPRVDAVDAHRQAPDRHDEPVTALGLPSGSDLVLVETRFAATTIEEPEAPRPRRARPPRVPIPDEPLQMVETHKHDNP